MDVSIYFPMNCLQLGAAVQLFCQVFVRTRERYEKQYAFTLTNFKRRQDFGVFKYSLEQKSREK